MKSKILAIILAVIGSICVLALFYPMHFHAAARYCFRLSISDEEGPREGCEIFVVHPASGIQKSVGITDSHGWIDFIAISRYEVTDNVLGMRFSESAREKIPIVVLVAEKRYEHAIAVEGLRSIPVEIVPANTAVEVNEYYADRIPPYRNTIMLRLDTGEGEFSVSPLDTDPGKDNAEAPLTEETSRP